MAELTKIDQKEVHYYNGSREMLADRRLKVILSGGDLENETVFNEKVPDGESWTVKLAVTKIINND